MPNEFGAGVTVNTVSRNTEIGRAERFVETIKRTHRFVSETKEWHVCEDGVWRKTDEKQVLHQAFLFVKQDAQRIAANPDLHLIFAISAAYRSHDSGFLVTTV